MRWSYVFLSCVLGCASKDGDDANAIEGTVNLDSRGHTADIHWNTAVAYAESDVLLVYLTGAPGASCHSIAEFLGPNDGPFEKDRVLQAGSCTLMIKVEGWTGDSTATHDPSSEELNPGVSSALNCNFGPGEWILETRNEEYEDYYWSGDYFLGRPEIFSWDISGDSGGIDLQVDFTRFTGNFPDETEFESHDAGADISGKMTASWCDELTNATVL